MNQTESSDTYEGDTERGMEVSLGPFEFRTPDGPCQMVACTEKADGVVGMENGSLNVCIYHAPQLLKHEQNEWTPLAGGRLLENPNQTSR